jgi:hypothetical protein
MFAVQGPTRSFPPPALDEARGRGRAIRPQERLRARSETQRESYSLDLTVRTAEGDTVKISVAALQQSEHTRLSYRDGRARLEAGSSATLSGFAATIEVEGDLNEQEIADIKKILATAQSQGAGAPQSLKSLESFALAYQHQVERAQTRVLAFA